MNFLVLFIDLNLNLEIEFVVKVLNKNFLTECNNKVTFSKILSYLLDLRYSVYKLIQLIIWIFENFYFNVVYQDLRFFKTVIKKYFNFFFKR